MHIVGHESVSAYFEVATDEEWRNGARRAPGLQRAGAVVLVTSQRSAYLDRYGEDDKSSSGLSDERSWPVPYWHTDAAMATMALLLLLEERGLAATLWGNGGLILTAKTSSRQCCSVAPTGTTSLRRRSIATWRRVRQE
jgi:hypothetical protein